MGNQPSPLESLAAYGIAFVAGAISLAAVATYGQLMRRRGVREVEVLVKESVCAFGS